MKSLKVSVAILIFSLGLMGCNQNSKLENSYSTIDSVESQELAMESEMDAINESSDSVMTSSAATYQDPKRKFVRKADVSMEVDNVYKSTIKVEAKLAEIGGFVEESQLSSNINSRQTFPISSDSAREVKRYTVRSQMTVRVPQEHLGAFLIALGDEIQFLNYRNISAEDVSLNMEWAKLEKERWNKTNQQLTALNHQSGKIKDKKEVIQSMSSNQSHVNQETFNTLKLNDEVNYSSIQLEFTEKEKIAETMVFNAKSYDDKYRPDFLYSAVNSLKGGYYLLQIVLLGLLYLWPLLILAILTFFFVKSIRNKNRFTHLKVKAQK